MKALDRQVGGGHYKDLAIQPFEYCQKNELRSGESAVIKYVTRHRNKNGKEDLEKAKHIIDMIIEMDYPENENPALNREITDAQNTIR